MVWAGARSEKVEHNGGRWCQVAGCTEATRARRARRGRRERQLEGVRVLPGGTGVGGRPSAQGALPRGPHGCDKRNGAGVCPICFVLHRVHACPAGSARAYTWPYLVWHSAGIIVFRAFTTAHRPRLNFDPTPFVFAAAPPEPTLAVSCRAREPPYRSRLPHTSPRALPCLLAWIFG